MFLVNLVMTTKTVAHCTFTTAGLPKAQEGPELVQVRSSFHSWAFPAKRLDEPGGIKAQKVVPHQASNRYLMS